MSKMGFASCEVGIREYRRVRPQRIGKSPPRLIVSGDRFQLFLTGMFRVSLHAQYGGRWLPRVIQSGESLTQARAMLTEPLQLSSKIRGATRAGPDEIHRGHSVRAPTGRLAGAQQHQWEDRHRTSLFRPFARQYLDGKHNARLAQEQERLAPFGEKLATFISAYNKVRRPKSDASRSLTEKAKDQLARKDKSSAMKLLDAALDADPSNSEASRTPIFWISPRAVAYFSV